MHIYSSANPFFATVYYSSEENNVIFITSVFTYNKFDQLRNVDALAHYIRNYLVFDRGIYIQMMWTYHEHPM